MKLYGRVAVITGGASGIGAAIAHRFRSEGANIALIDRDAEALDEVLRSLDGSEDAKMAAVSDVSDAAAAGDGMSQVLARWGRIDILVTAAGISIGGTVASTDEISWDRVFAINVRGTFLWAREAIPHMAASGRGSIITVGSQLAISSGSFAQNVSIGSRPWGISSNTERSRSPKTTIAAVRGIGVAVITSRSGSAASSERSRLAVS